MTACTKANGCFKKVNEKGEEANYPAEGGEVEKIWSLESSLDMDMVSAACSNCHIMLVEATTQEPKDTAASAEEAAKLGAKEISNSYGYPEDNETYCPAKKGCKEYLSDYDHAGIPVTVSAGDSGYNDALGGYAAPNWPATSPNVIAVGGTNLTKASNSRGWKETVWDDSGSGCSLYEAKPSWQFDTACSKRTDNDVSAVASPETPVSVYNTPYAGGWTNVGGTSASAPLVAGIEAHAESTVKSAGAEAFYKHPGMLFDVTAGRNGTCTPPAEDAYLCAARAGYDGPTGWGTPDAVPHLSGWFTRTIPNLADGRYASQHIGLASVSCVTTTGVCTAVGRYLSGTAEAPLLERSVGGPWEGQEIPSPTGAKSSVLTSVSCRITEGFPTAEACEAVGHYIDSSGAEQGFSEQWNAGSVVPRWEVQSIAVPKEAKSTSLLGVSCVGVVCMAVGHYVNSAGAEVLLAERLPNGGPWAISEIVTPKEVKSSSLSGISCISLSGLEGCMAVGHSVSNGGVESVLAEEWLLSKWKISATVTPEGAKSSSLSGMTCSGQCDGVGRYVNAAGKEVPLIESFTIEKETWTLLEAPSPTEAKGASLASVSCNGAERCTAVGQYVNSGGTELTLAELYTGASKKWAVQESANPAGAKSAASSSVSCIGTETCDEVGHYVESAGLELPLAEEFTSTSKKWTLVEAYGPTEATGSLAGVSCTSTEACTAAGHLLNSAGVDATLAERWNGKEWSLQETPNPTGTKGSVLSGVSCATAEACSAVGHYTNSSGVEVTLAEVWNSKKWSIQESPNPTGAKSAALSGVSCTAAEACTAVGYYVTSGGVEETLAEVYTSTSKKWAIQESPNPTGAKSAALSGVSCTAAEACTAVGYYVTSGGVEETLAEVYTSTSKKWAIQESPNPAGAKASSLAGVSCTAAEACTAVGYYVTSGGVEETLAEVYTSTSKKWAIQESPNPAGAKASSLAGVSCTAAEACTAVGHYVTSGGVEETLAEVFTSTAKKWAIQETPNAEEEKNSLAGVSCKTATTCIAAGHATTAAAAETALVEEHG